MQDEQLIYLINECYSKQAFNILYKRYFDEISLMAETKVFRIFYSFSLEKDDLFTEAYYSFIKAIETYDYRHFKLPFSRFLFLVIRNNFFKLAKQDLHDKHKVMNDFISFNKFESLDCLDGVAGYDEEQKLIEDITKQEVFKKINEMRQKHPKQYLGYSTILLRLEGYSVDEICKELKVTRKFVFNNYTILLKKIKNELSTDSICE